MITITLQNTSNIKDNGEEENLIENIDLDDSDEDACVEDDVSDNDFESIQMCTFTLKKLVRLLHLKEPAEVVMGLIGKRYWKT